MAIHRSLLVYISAMLLSALSQGCRNSPAHHTQDVKTDSTVNQGSKTLNQIRFEGWTEKDWADNEYYRCIRKTFDDYLAGKIQRKDLDEYKDIIPGKFLIYDVSPYIMGGLYIKLVFMDEPEKLYSTVVYSYVDEDTKEITGYEMRGFSLDDFELSLTKEDLRQYLEDCPEAKPF